jgi:hypothetical protein
VQLPAERHLGVPAANRNADGPLNLACGLAASIKHVAEWYPDRLYDEVSLALHAAIAELTNLDAGITLRHLPIGSDAEIELYLPLATLGDVVRYAGDTLPRAELVASACFLLSADGNGWPAGSKTILPRDIRDSKVRSVVLEELTQSHGPPYDASRKPYASASIFDRKGDASYELCGQDKSALSI